MQYEMSITYGLEVMAKVKVFVHATAADADGRAMTLAPRTYLSRLTKKDCYYNISKLFGIVDFKLLIHVVT